MGVNTDPDDDIWEVSRLPSGLIAVTVDDHSSPTAMTVHLTIDQAQQFVEDLQAAIRAAVVDGHT